MSITTPTSSTLNPTLQTNIIPNQTTDSISLLTIPTINFNRFNLNSLGLTYKLLKDNTTLKEIKNKNLYHVIVKLGIENIVDEKTLIGHEKGVTCVVKINDSTIASGGFDSRIFHCCPC